MTIASEITRIQWAKSDIRQAIIDKWVDVCADLTIDNYACCIDAIQTWWWEKYYELLVVAWWWGGWNWWWWAWGVVHKTISLSDNTYNIIVWKWWCKWACSYVYWCNWWDSQFWDIIAYWWGWWWPCSYCACRWCNWWSWWGRWHNYCYTSESYIWKWCIIWLEAQWRDWGNWWTNNCYLYPFGWWSWWWATQEWSGAYSNHSAGVEFDISWENVIYSWWGWGGTRWCDARQAIWWSGVWWNWAVYSNNCSADRCPATNPSTCWSWGWWGNPCWCNPTSWADWVVIIRYPTAMWDTSWWGCKYTCWDYTIHCFTLDWIFITDTSKKQIRYLAVWWGWGWDIWWGGWWEVKTWEIWFEDTLSLNITIWAWGNWWTCSAGNATDWWDTCLWDIVAYWWKRATFTRCSGLTTSWCWWTSWSGRVWWQSRYCCGNICYTYWWWWGWACWNWWWGSRCCWWSWGKWVLGYWWWGWWGACAWYSWCWKDWWWNGAYCYWNNATNYWWWWGWWARCMWWSWYQWVVDICYPCDWSFWFTTATWGDSCYLCWDICVHRFTSNGTFTVVS